MKYQDDMSAPLETPMMRSISRILVSFSVMSAEGVRKVLKDAKTMKYQPHTLSTME